MKIFVKSTSSWGSVWSACLWLRAWFVCGAVLACLCRVFRAPPGPGRGVALGGCPFGCLCMVLRGAVSHHRTFLWWRGVLWGAVLGRFGGGHSGLHGGSAWGVLGGFGVGGRGRCRAWAGPGASGGWIVRFSMGMITPTQRHPLSQFFFFYLL